MAHERMINNQGRKVVHERLGGASGEERSQNLFRNMAESDAAGFDEEWNRMAKHMGFDSHMHNRLGYASGGGDPFA